MRRLIVSAAYHANHGHIPSALSIVEIMKSFNQVETEDDVMILSKGHGVMAQYACMKELGWLNDDDLFNYFSDGTELKGLSDSRVRGLEVTSGSLGHGLSVGVGIALGHHINKSQQKTFIIVGDGELNEGSCWEAIQFAGHHKLKNICMIVDKNNFQAMGETAKIINQDNLGQQIESFNFNVIEIDGHDEVVIDETIKQIYSSSNGKPNCIIANTVKGKGISFMENKNDWHYSRLDQSLYEAALLELEK